MTPLPRIQVYILCRDRPAFLRETLHSVVSQNFRGYELVVSDNSEFDEVEAMVAAEYPDLNYMRRQPALGALEHFRTIINECRSKYVVLFHDDDLMLSGFLERIAACLDDDPALSAVGCNAYFIRDSIRTHEPFMKGFASPRRFTAPEDFLTTYLGLLAERHAPFPGYMYRSAAIKGLYLDPREGGKYSDVSFLLKVLSRGPIVWLPEPLMYYRVHPGSDSQQERIGQKLSLLRYVYKNTCLNKSSDMVVDYRFSFWAKWFLEGGGRSASCRRRLIVFSFLFRRSMRLAFTRRYFWVRSWQFLKDNLHLR